MDNLFPKKEKLKHQKTIQKVFSEGKVIKNFPLMFIYIKDDLLDSPKIGVSVSKKNFKKAVDRNKIKRQLREVYRLNKSKLLKKISSPFSAFIVYTGKEKIDYHRLQEKYLTLIEKLNDTHP